MDSAELALESGVVRFLRSVVGSSSDLPFACESLVYPSDAPMSWIVPMKSLSNIWDNPRSKADNVLVSRRAAKAWQAYYVDQHHLYSFADTRTLICAD